MTTITITNRQATAFGSALRLAYFLNGTPGLDGEPCREAFRTAKAILDSLGIDPGVSLGDFIFSGHEDVDVILMEVFHAFRDAGIDVRQGDWTGDYPIPTIGSTITVPAGRLSFSGQFEVIDYGVEHGYAYLVVRRGADTRTHVFGVDIDEARTVLPKA